MAFKKLNSDQALTSLLEYILSSVDEIEESQTLEEHKKTVEKQETSEKPSTGSLTILEKLELIVDDVLDQIIAGNTAIESGAELNDIAKVVSTLEAMKCPS